MYGAKILALIADGENERAEFKRELHLETAEAKAEFIKDIVALANTAADTAYMLLGVDNEKRIIGISQIEEERIQQIVSAYVEPRIVLRCSLVALRAEAVAGVGILEIRPTERPHEVASAIGRLQKHDVFVRHGSVVEKASPSEMFRMRDLSRLNLERRHYVKAAEIHVKIGELDNAVSAFSKAIELMPAAELFLARGQAYAQKSDREEDYRAADSLAELAFKDFSNAISLALSRDLERQARLGQIRLWSRVVEGDESIYDRLTQDKEWLEANTIGAELGEVLYWPWQATEDLNGLREFAHDALPDLNRSIELGYNDPQVFYLRSIAHFYLDNFALALQDIDTAIKACKESLETVRYLPLRANILASMKRFNEAHESLSQARQLSKGQFHDDWGYIASGIEWEIIYRYCLAYEFGGNPREIEEMRSVVQALLLKKVSGVVLLEPGENGQVKQERATVRRMFPKLVGIIRKIVGEEFWQANRDTLE